TVINSHSTINMSILSSAITKVNSKSVVANKSTLGKNVVNSASNTHNRHKRNVLSSSQNNVKRTDNRNRNSARNNSRDNDVMRKTSVNNKTNAVSVGNVVTMLRMMNKTLLPKNRRHNPHSSNLSLPSRYLAINRKNARTCQHATTRNNVMTPKSNTPSTMTNNAALKGYETGNNPNAPVTLALQQSRLTQAKMIPCPLRSRQHNGPHRHYMKVRLAL